MTLRYRTWPVFTIGLTSLLLLIAVPGVATVQRISGMYREVRSIQKSYNDTQLVLAALSADIYQASVTVRDFLLDTAPGSSIVYRRQAESARSVIDKNLEQVRRSLRPEDFGPFERLKAELNTYWNSVMPVFDWTPAEKFERGTYFLRQQQRPRRQSLLAITDELGSLNARNYQRQVEELGRAQQTFESDLRQLVGAALLVGLIVAVASVFRISSLEHRAQYQQVETERTGKEMRNLSHQLMHAQEEERRTISRELHDEVGQMLTGLRMELGSLERVKSDLGFQEHLNEAKQIAEQAMRTVRDLAVGLRPSVLDDLGLAPALEWQAREFSRRTGIPANVEITNEPENLPERHRTCLYRIVQEALTNCAKHAEAKHVRIRLTGEPDGVVLSVEDDGRGMEFRKNGSTGIGLLGMEERVKELRGQLTVRSEAGRGTIVTARIPVSTEVPA